MNIVIIGGDAAGMSAAMQIVRAQPKWQITVLEKGAIYSYGQCGLPYYIGGIIKSHNELIIRAREVFQERYGIDARIYHEVTEINHKKQRVIGTYYEGNSAKNFSLPYDKLIVASGASPVMPPFTGKNLAGIHVLKTIPDAQKIIDELTSNVLNVTVIGAGYIGLEVTENLVASGRKVTLIDTADQIGSSLYESDISEKIKQEAIKNGVEVLLSTSVSGFEGDGQVERVITNNGPLETDMVIVAAGIKPNTDFFTNTDIHLHQSGAIVVNPYMETTLPHVYAAGDCATHYHRLKQRDDYIPLGTHANKQGRIAGANVTGNRKAFKGVVGSAIVKFFDVTIGKTGLNEKEATELGIACCKLSYTTTTHASYYPGNNQLFIHMIKNRDTDVLLGVQAVGAIGVDKRIDVAATALYHEMTTEDLENLDLSYAPPFNSPWDPIQQGARRL
ncbi:FAD-dependent oxidoreductase [Salipaludibacillus agaradhaerens]|uniref:FAD-dependent oxidoreductase n=1 Tax=Salipaludibacillus agaradhaerens TaxID=76935 RepID=UPI002151D944|nr:FAD-dependent oxidoreductase [Salipaludibacillus agaradhaerens]MCR6108247.1 FAD-dependent oxidoreductase [Salipaludibacillus agaradhaerens]MCR6120272.1 FAD-dependent oxidoreductase [Salipaludibacillus agaradhaerens]